MLRASISWLLAPRSPARSLVRHHSPPCLRSLKPCHPAIMKVVSALIIATAACSAKAFAPSTSAQSTTTTALSATRREVGSAAFGVAAAILFTGASAAQAEAESNELVDTLKARSEANKEANKQYAMRADKMSSRDFKDVKTRKPKFVSIKIAGGKTKLITSDEFATLENDGKIRTEYGTRMKQGGGEMVDYTNVSYYLEE